MISREPTLERLATAQSLLLAPFGLNESHLTRALAAITTNKVDDADLYFQYTRSEGWSLEEGIAYDLRPVAEADVFAADEVLLSSATKEVLPVTVIDGEPVGHGALRGKPGPVYARLYEAYQRAKRAQAI